MFEGTPTNKLCLEEKFLNKFVLNFGPNYMGIVFVLILTFNFIVDVMTHVADKHLTMFKI